MRAWIDQLPTEARWVLGTGTLGALVLVGSLMLELAGALVESLQDRGRYKPRIERLLGYEATADELRASSVEFGRAVQRLAYPVSDDASSAGARLQQTLRGFAEDSGLTVVGSQLAVISAENDEEGLSPERELFDQLAVDLSLDGPPLALDAFLVAISQHSPSLAAVSIDIQRKRRSRRDGDETLEFLTVRLRVVALRVAT